MPSAIGSTLEFSEIRATEISKYQDLRLRITLDGNIQESQESTLDAGVHTWREPFSFDAGFSSQCEIHVLAKKRRFFCCAGRYKVIRATRRRTVGELLCTRSNDGGDVQLPLYSSSRTDENGVVVGSVMLSIAEMPVMNDSKGLCTRDSVSWQESGAASSRSPSPEAVPEKLSLVASESEGSTSPPPRPKAPTPPASTTSETHHPPYFPPQPSLAPSSDVFTPQYLQTSSQLPQFNLACSPQESGVDRVLPEITTRGDAALHPRSVLSPDILSDETMTATSSLIDEDEQSGLMPQGSALGSFTPVICEPPEDMVFEGFADPSCPIPPDMSGPTSFILPTPSNTLGHGTIPQISITLAGSSRGNSPQAHSSCESDVTIKRPSVHVDTGSSSQLNVSSALSRSPGFSDEVSPYSHSAVLASPQPTTSTTNTSSSGLSPFSRSSMVESPSTAATTPAQSATSDAPKDPLASPPGSAKRKERPTIDTSCVGPRGQVRKYRNGSVPPVHVPVKLRNSSLDLPRHNEYERYEPNPSMYSIAPSISPRHFKKSGELRSPSLQPGSRQGFASSTHAPSIRREALEFDDAQICLDTANLGDQEVATFLKEVDAALSAIVHGTPAVAADSRAFLAVPSRLGSRHQSRKPSSQHLRADLSATIRSHEKEGTARTGFSLVATSHPSPHPDVIPSKAVSPLSGHAESVPRLFVSQLDMNATSSPGSPSRNAVHGFPLRQRVSPQPSPRHELVEWLPSASVPSASARAKEPLHFGAADSYYGDV